MNNQPCLIFAHRGANREAVENTRAAFDKALEYSIDGIETDVQLSLDDEPVLWHDWYLDKLGQPGKCTDDFTLEQLEQMGSAKPYSSSIMPEGILSLKEFISTYRGRCGLDIELKSRDGESQQRLERKILKMMGIIGKYPSDGVFISSYSLPSLIFVHQCVAHFPLYYLLSSHSIQTDIERLLKDHNFLAGVCLPIDIVNETIAGLLHDKGKGLIVYTCNRVEDIQKALDVKANILITDYPQLALQIRDSK